VRRQLPNAVRVRPLAVLAAVLLPALSGCGGTSTTDTTSQSQTRPTTPSNLKERPGLIYGINSNSAGGHSAIWVAHNVLGDRSNNLDVGPEANPTEVSEAVATSLADGCRPLVIINTEDSRPLSNVNPSEYASGARAIIQRVVADHPTVRTFELINEPYFKGPQHKSNASDYANIVAKTYEAVASLGMRDIKLLVAGWGRYELVNGGGEGTGKLSDPEQGGGWIHDMAVQQPGLRQVVNGWTSHPYGAPEGPSEHHDYGMTATADQRNDATLAGFNAAGRDNWWITEVGFELGGGGANSAGSETSQARDILTVLSRALAWHSEGWLRGILIYDDGGSGYNVYGRAAGVTLARFATAHR
jgi:hypothetical protein